MKTKKFNKTAQSKPSQSSLAASLGVSRQLIAAHLKSGDAPPLSDATGWTVYLAQKGRIGSAPQDLRRAIAQKRLEILKETKIKLARENEIQSGKLISIADAERQTAEGMGMVFAELERMARELPPALAGCTAVEIYIRMSKNIEDIRKQLKAKFQNIGK